MKHVMVLLLLGTTAFGQEAPTMSDKSTQSKPFSMSKRGNRVFYFKDSTGTATGKSAIPFQGRRYEPRPGNRVFYFKDSTGAATEKSAVPAQGEAGKK